MSSILLAAGTFVLILISLFLILVILMQRANSSGGLGTAFGGGMAESAFGTDTGNVLSKSTVWASVAFFVLSVLLYLGYMYTSASAKLAKDADTLPVIEEKVEANNGTAEGAKSVVSTSEEEAEDVVENTESVGDEQPLQSEGAEAATKE